MRRAIAGGVVLAVGIVLFGAGNDTSAFTNQWVSPITADMVNTSTNGPDATVKHVLKHENSSTIARIDMVAYYNRSSVNANQTFEIFGRDTGTDNMQRCHTYPDGNTTAGLVRVTLSVDTTAVGANAQTITYLVRGDNVCEANGGRVNTRANNNGGANQFFTTYQVPSGFNQTQAIVDDDTGLYKVNIRIQYPTDVAGNPTIPQGTTGGNDLLKQQISFRTRISATSTCPTPSAQSSTNCARYLGMAAIPAGGGNFSRNYSTLGTIISSNWHYTRQFFKFGLPCSQATAQAMRLSVYDVDNGNSNWNNMHIRVEKSTNNGVTYTPLSTSTGGAERLVVTGPGFTTTAQGAVPNARIWPADGDRTTMSIAFTLQPGANYRLVADSVHSRNLFGIGLPTDTIFGVISCNYSLSPSLSVASTSLVPGGSISGIVGGVTNGGDGASLTPSAFGVTRFVLPRGAGTLVRGTTGTTTLANNTNFGCQIANYVATGVTNCSNLFTDAAGRTYPVGATNRYNGNDPLSGVNVEPGDRVCYVSMVNNYGPTTSTADWRYGNTICVLVGKRPNVQVWGNDLRVGGRYASDTSNTNDASIRTSLMRIGDYYGSWTEYGVLAPGYVAGMSSGSGLANGNPSGAQAQWSDLTFANSTADARCLATGSGCFSTGASMGVLPDVNQAVDDGIFAGVPITENTTGTIGATANFNSSRIIRRVGGTITITGNITAAPGPYNDRNIPQMVIIADRINIAGSVTRVDAWLVATGTNGLINTCSDVADTASLTLTTCDQPLIVNGPTIAKSLLLRRTAGADSAATADDPAERFNLRSDTYIWAYDKAQQTGTIRTSYMRELAPRY